MEVGCDLLVLAEKPKTQSIACYGTGEVSSSAGISLDGYLHSMPE